MDTPLLYDFCGQSLLWNNSAIWYTDRPEILQCFQKTVLVWVPFAFLLVGVPIELYLVSGYKRSAIPWNILHISKLIINVLLILATVGDFINQLYNSNSQGISPVDIVAFIFLICCFVVMMLHVTVGRFKGVCSSGVAFFFWLILTVCFGVSYITLWWKIIEERRLPQALSYIYTTIVFTLSVSQLVLASFADVSHAYIDEKECPEVKASFPSKLYFSWFDSLVLLGCRRSLRHDDLWTLQTKLTSEVNSHQFEVQWDKEIQRKKRRYLRSANRSRHNLPPRTTQSPSVSVVLWKTYGLFFLLLLLMRFISDSMFVVSPLMLRKIIAHLEDKNDPPWHGYFYCFIILISGLVQYILLDQHLYYCQTLGLRIRAALILAIYKKALRMSSSAKRQSTIGEIVNLMGIDTQRILEVTLELGGLFTVPLQIFIASYLLWDMFGIASLAGVGTMFVLLPINMVIIYRVKKLQVSIMELKDDRVKLVNEILNGIKVLKLYAWELSFYHLIQKIRQKELAIIRSVAYLQCIVVFFFNCTPFVIALVTFGTYVMIDEKNVLDASKAFVSISVLFLIKAPLLTLPTVVVRVLQAVISVNRIQHFMQSTDLDPTAVQHDSVEAAISISNGSFAWTEDEDTILRDIELTIPHGHIVAVVGSVGAGKSSLLSAILGEMIKRSGHVNTQGRIAYVSQQAWLQNATLRSNILLGKKYEKSTYDEVLEACALGPDIEMLPGGDFTEIGEKGINLSGGQKQRVSLARAVYNDADLYLLDDPLSAVDAHVGKHIFEKVIGPKGILRKKTRLLVTHNLSYLKEMDSIVFLSNGKITEAGTYNDLMKKQGSFADLVNCYIVNNDQKEEDPEQHVSKPNFRRQISRQWSEISQLSRSLSEASICLSDTDSSFPPISLESISDHVMEKQVSRAEDVGKLTDAEEMEKGQVNWRIYVHYLRSMGVFMTLIALGFYVASWTSSVGSNIWLKDWSADNVSESRDIEHRNFRLGIYFVFGLVQAICIYLAAIIATLGVLRATKHLHNQLLLNLLQATMAFFDTTPLGRIISRFSRDIDIMDLVMPHVVRPIFNNTIQLVSIIVVVIIGAPIIMTVGVAMAIFYYILQRIYINTARQLKRLESVSRSPIYTHFSETLSGMITLRAYKMQDAFVSESMKRVDSNHEALFPSLTAVRWLALRLDLIASTVIFFSIFFLLMRRDTIDVGTVGLTVSYAIQLTTILGNVVRVNTELENNMVAAERIRQYSMAPREAPWEIAESKPPNDWPQEGCVVFQQYSTEYRKGLGTILKGISCNIQAGEKIGIVGRTGAGKSSLTLALFRIIEATEGSILIDGRDIGKMGLHDLRSRLTIIPQDPVLFSCSLRTNLDPFDEYTDEQIWTALELAHLKAYVTSLPGGLNHMVSEGGENLSVGQRQLVCLARALLRKTKVLVLDEATAAVDMETDDVIQATIRREFISCTVLTIAHRLNTIMDSTRILVLDKGIIEEFNTPAKLLENKNSLFYSMVKDAGLL